MIAVKATLSSTAGAWLDRCSRRLEIVVEPKRKAAR